MTQHLRCRIPANQRGRHTGLVHRPRKSAATPATQVRTTIPSWLRWWKSENRKATCRLIAKKCRSSTIGRSCRYPTSPRSQFKRASTVLLLLLQAEAEWPCAGVRTIPFSNWGRTASANGLAFKTRKEKGNAACLAPALWFLCVDELTIV